MDQMKKFCNILRVELKLYKLLGPCEGRGACAMKPEDEIEEGGKKGISAQPDGPNAGARLWG